jgi:hypothetical protein
LSDSVGKFVISLDFELFWGVRDKRALSDCEQRLAGVWAAVPEMLSAFDKCGINATWSTVGLLFCSGKEEVLECRPQLLPSYSDENLSPYTYLGKKASIEKRFHFAPELIQLIGDTRGQEVGTHTFSHFYCLEPGQTVAEFREDMMAAFSVAKKYGYGIESLVFPRNQSSQEYIDVFKELGGRVYRGQERHKVYRASAGQRQTIIDRAVRLLDAYINITGSNTIKLGDCLEDGIVNIPSSRLLRPYSKRLSAFEPLKLRRIKSAMTYAAKHGEVFHLWWHPHNFGVDLKRNMATLHQILEHYQLLASRYGMETKTMAEVASSLLKAD